jgi:hypothetical protein
VEDLVRTLGHEVSLGGLECHDAWNIRLGHGPSVQLPLDLEIVDGVVKEANLFIEALLP